MTTNLQNLKKQTRKELRQIDRMLAKRVDRMLAKLNRSASRKSMDTFKARKVVGRAIRRIEKAHG